MPLISFTYEYHSRGSALANLTSPKGGLLSQAFVLKGTPEYRLVHHQMCEFSRCSAFTQTTFNIKKFFELSIFRQGISL